MPPSPPSIEDRLFREPFSFDFFQAVRMLEKLRPDAVPVGRGGPPKNEVVRFRAQVSTAFPPSAVHDLAKPGGSTPVPVMTIAFFGVTGPNGILPRHYTELLLKIARESKGAEKYALRDWYDLFNHRLSSLFYRAWEKYRFWIPFERGEGRRIEPDAFTRSLLALVGIEPPSLRGRLQLVEVAAADEHRDESRRVLTRIDDFSLLYYGGLLAQRTRNASGLEAMLADYFGLPVQVVQFVGQWLMLEPENQSSLGSAGANNRLGVDCVAGERVWDIQGKIRIRVGPLDFERFLDFVPNRADAARHNAYFRIVQLTRFYVGPDLDFEIQPILRREDVPECRMTDDLAQRPLLGWNTWIRSQPLDHDADDAVFAAREFYELTSSGIRI
ncbi:MAG: type VI secretion system baseplate subunit TssG [Isosphaeraceae bacterium]|nr:type VI secretion system baseplate subunit TssG [Isosphaeraceae bacterium]